MLSGTSSGALSEIYALANVKLLLLLCYYPGRNSHEDLMVLLNVILGDLISFSARSLT